LEEYEEDRLNNLKKYDDDDLESIFLVILEKLEENYVTLMNKDFLEVTEFVNKLLAENSFTVARKPTLIRKLFRELTDRGAEST
jgi:hypothetical protein